MSFSSVSSAWLFALLIPLVLFYFLKLKRPRAEIPSLVLWRQVLSDQRVNSPFQRFKRHFLLLLQILLLCLLALAAMQPFLKRESGRGARLVILIDTSASMAALDREGGRTRVDEVRERVREVIGGMLPGQEISLIAFSRHARRLTPFTDNQRDLRTALDDLETEDVPSDLEEALRMAQALARDTALEKVLLFSDGNFPPKANFELPFAIDFQRLAPAGPNFGITACEARRVAGGKWNVFIQLDGSANAAAVTGALELRQNGAVIATEDLTLSPGRSPRLSFTVASDEASSLHAHLRLAGFDSLATDDNAWLTLPPARPLDVFVAPKLASYRHALAAMPGINLFPDDTGKLPAAFDLLISDVAADLTLPARVRCGIGLVPEEVKPLFTIENRNAQAIDWRRDSPLLQHVSLSDVIFMDEPTNAPGVDDARYAGLGYEILARGPRGPLILARSDDNTFHINLLFHTDRSTLPYRVGFPVFVANLVQTALQRTGLAEVAAARTGVLPSLTFASEKTYRIEGPRGLGREESTDDRGQLSGVPAPRAGEYSITGPETAAVHIGASLLSPSETMLQGVEQIEFNDRLTVTAASAPAKIDRPLWWPLTAIGLALLLVEWWWFQRRPGAVV